MTGISTLGASVDQIARLKVQQNSLDLLSTQISTGKKTQQFSGLGTDILRSQRARADINALEQYTTNIQNAHRRIQLMNGSLEQVRTQTNLIAQGLTVGVQEGDAPDFETTQRLAEDVYDFVIDLINTKDGDRYLFAGADSSIKPIEDEGLFDSILGNFIPDETDITNPPLQASGYIGDWGDGTITTEEFIAAYQATNENILGYSDSLISGTTGDVRVRVDENSDFDYTVLGNSEGLKEIVLALGVLKNLPPPEYAPGALNDPLVTTAAEDTAPFPSREKQDNFYQVFNDLKQTLIQAVDKIEAEEYRLGLIEAQTAVIEEQHEYQINAFKTTISEVEDVDLTESVAKIQQAQVSLQASFSVTSILADLSLVNFLTR
jgi:flagellar hook-associated protein 3 FlgL